MDETQKAPGTQDGMAPEATPMTEEEIKKKEAEEAAVAAPEAPAEEAPQA